MKIKTYVVYKFDELSDEAKQNVIDRFSTINVDHEWWEYLYNDAEELGFSIIAFDCGHGEIKLKLIDYCWMEVADNILKAHAETSPMVKTVEAFLTARDNILSGPERDGWRDLLDKCEDEFAQDIGEDYLSRLCAEYDYQTSEEAIIETIKANDYDFTEDGKLD